MAADPVPPAATKTNAVASKAASRNAAHSTFVAKARIVWRGDLVSARGYTSDLVDAFRKEKEGLLTVQPFSTVSGIDAVIDGSADIAGSARAMLETRDVERNLIFQPIALDAIVPVTHPKNPLNSITLAQLRQIYLGRISNWKDLGGADAPINLYSIAAPLDGVEFSFRRLLYRHGDQRIAAPRLYLNTAKLEEAIAIDPNSLGLTTLSGSYANKALKMLAVEGISASTQSIADGSYPLFNTLYVVQREDAANRAAVDDFTLFLNSPTALQVMRRHQLVPYSEAGDVYTRDGDPPRFHRFGHRRGHPRRCRRHAPGPRSSTADVGTSRHARVRHQLCPRLGKHTECARKSVQEGRVPDRCSRRWPSTLEFRLKAIPGDMEIRAISLDLDDTLWPIGPVIQRVEQSVDLWLRSNCPEVADAWPVESLRRLRDQVAEEHPELAHDFGAQRRLTLRRVFEPFQMGEEWVERTYEVYVRVRNEVECYADTASALAEMAARVPLISISNGTADLGRIGLNEHFKFSVSAGEIGVAKPDASIFLHACERLDVAPHHVLHVGDDPLADVIGARDAGLRTAWLNRHGVSWAQESPPDLVVNDLKALSDWLAAHTASRDNPRP